MKTSENALDGQYPESWDEYIGQERAKKQLRRSIASAAARGAQLDHVLIQSRYPGIGKTALGLMIAREMDVPVLVVSGTMRMQDARMTLPRLKDGNVLFIDEIHRLVEGGKGKAEWLLHYLENGTLLGPGGAERAPRLTVIAATTDVGKLPETLRDRFPIQPTLVPYNDEEGAQIAAGLAAKLLGDLPAPNQETLESVASAASNRPRYMRRILIAMRDLAVTGENEPTEEGKYEMSEALDCAGLSPDGLTEEARRYLMVLAKEFNGGPAGERVLSQRLGEVGSGLADIEGLLLDKGLLLTSSQGRMLSGDGIERALALEEEME